MSIAETLAALKDGTDEAKASAALKLRTSLDGLSPSALNDEIFEAGGVAPLLVDLLELSLIGDRVDMEVGKRFPLSFSTFPA